MRLALETELRQHDRRALKAVGLDDVGAGIEIGTMDLENPVGVRATKVFVASV
jgi:hypothetical protein